MISIVEHPFAPPIYVTTREALALSQMYNEYKVRKMREDYYIMKCKIYKEVLEEWNKN